MTGLASFTIRPGEPGTRRNQLVESRPSLLRAAVEDNFHHFWMEIEHDGARILDMRTGAVRQPWSTCDAAGVFLGERMKGRRLDELATVDSPFAHCTHQHDLILLAAAHLNDPGPVLFSSFVSDRFEPSRTAELYRNGEPLLMWEVDAAGLVLSGADVGQSLRKLKEWEAMLSTEEREAARILRRTILIAGGRFFDYSKTPTADRVKGSAGACYTFQPDRASASKLTMKQLDFTHQGVPLRSRLEEIAAKDG